MKAKDSTVRNGAGDAPPDSLRVELPIASDYSPHHAGEVVALLDSAQPEPADSERRAKPSRRRPGMAANRFLGSGKFNLHEFGGAEIESGVRVRMISDFVASLGHFARHMLPAGDPVDAYLARLNARPALARAMAKDDRP